MPYMGSVHEAQMNTKKDAPKMASMSLSPDGHDLARQMESMCFSDGTPVGNGNILARHCLKWRLCPCHPTATPSSSQ